MITAHGDRVLFGKYRCIYIVRGNKLFDVYVHIINYIKICLRQIWVMTDISVLVPDCELSIGSLVQKKINKASTVMNDVFSMSY